MGSMGSWGRTGDWHTNPLPELTMHSMAIRSRTLFTRCLAGWILRFDWGLHLFDFEPRQSCRCSSVLQRYPVQEQDTNGASLDQTATTHDVCPHMPPAMQRCSDAASTPTTNKQQRERVAGGRELEHASTSSTNRTRPSARSPLVRVRFPPF